MAQDGQNVELPEETPAVNAISAQLPVFWSTKPRLWFAQVDAVFESSRVTRDRTKYLHVLAKLPELVLESISDIIDEVAEQAPPDAFIRLRERLTGSYGLTQWQQLARLVDHPGLGDMRPSALMNQLLALLPAGEKPTMLFQYHFLRHLPADIRGQLATKKFETARALATEADFVWDARGGGATIGALPSRSTSPRGGRRQSPDRGRRRRAQTPGKKESQQTGLCFYHSRFGDKANSCRPPCTWTGNGQAADD
jgi:hypothetical protein